MGDAEAAFRKAAVLNGSFNSTALYEVGRVLLARGAFFEARSVLKQARKQIPDDERVQTALADVERVIRVKSESPER